MPTEDDISNFCQSGATLKPDDIEDHTSYTIQAWRSKVWDEGNTPTVYLKLAGVEKEFRANATNLRRIAGMYGTGMNGWIGKSITLFVDKVQKPGGGLVDSIKVSVRRKPAIKPTPDHDDDLNDEIPF